MDPRRGSNSRSRPVILSSGIRSKLYEALTSEAETDGMVFAAAHELDDLADAMRDDFERFR